MAITQTLTPFPDPPRIYQPEEEFDAKADEMAGHLPILTTEINALIPQINSTATDITTKHSDVVTKHDEVMTTAQQMQINSTALQTAVNSASGSATNAASSASDAATSSAASATNAAYAKNKIDHLISRSAMTPSNDATQLQRAVMNNSPIIRLTKNQALTGSSGSPPTGWYGHPNCTFENVCNVGSDANPENRHPLAKELLDYIGIRNVAYFGRGFNIWRITWPAGTPSLMHQFLNLTNYLSTVAAYTKLESGAVFGAWADGATNTWKLTGQQTGGNMPHTYWMIHPYPVNNGAGSLLFALPAAVIGPVDLNNQQNWALYPYIGDTQYD